MTSLNIHEAKTTLSRVLAQIERDGSRFTICRNGQPVADLVPHVPSRRSRVDPFLSRVRIHGDIMTPTAIEDWENK